MFDSIYFCTSFISIFCLILFTSTRHFYNIVRSKIVQLNLYRKNSKFGPICELELLIEYLKHFPIIIFVERYIETYVLYHFAYSCKETFLQFLKIYFLASNIHYMKKSASSFFPL